MLWKLDKATSLFEHLKMFKDFYRRQNMLGDNPPRRPKDPEREISEAEFMKFWMGHLDFSQN